MSSDKLGFIAHFVRTNQGDKKVFIQLFSKSWRGQGRVALVFSVSFDSFSLRLFRQRKAAKDFCYQRFFNAFSFEERGPKEKALQKEKGRIRGAARSTPRHCAWSTTFKKVDETIAKSKCEHPDKSKFEITNTNYLYPKYK